MMLFWILAITDLIMVGITWAVYGSSATYRDGMLLGVHPHHPCERSHSL